MAVEKRPLSEAELEKLRAYVVDRAQHMSEDELKDILASEPKAERKMARLGNSLPALVKQVRVGFAMVRDYAKGDYRKVPWWSVASVAAALGYFLAPTDLIPDLLPIIGYLDDATVLAAVMTAIREDLKRYAEARGIEIPE
jgi:uncharacterized membrane protein YkvA (DUF1232 family)